MRIPAIPAHELALSRPANYSYQISSVSSSIATHIRYPVVRRYPLASLRGLDMDKDPPGTSKGSTGPGDPADGATPPKAMLTEKDVEAIAELMLKKFKDHESAEPKD